MIAADDYILGNGALHERFRLTTEILGALVSCAPRSLTIAQLQTYTGVPAKDLVKLCGALWRAMLTKPDKEVRGSWTLACTPSAVTLEDVFRCVIAEQPRSVKQAAAANAANAAKPDEMDKRQHDIDLLVSQATMAINQSVFRQLRQFSLDRLKVSAAAKPPSRRHYKYDNVHDFEVNPWFI